MRHTLLNSLLGCTERRQFLLVQAILIFPQKIKPAIDEFVCMCQAFDRGLITVPFVRVSRAVSLKLQRKLREFLRVVLLHSRCSLESLCIPSGERGTWRQGTKGSIDPIGVAPYLEVREEGKMS